eukprot:scaffold12740_cov153-Skeletonema_marinoi.AAC.2
MLLKATITTRPWSHCNMLPTYVSTISINKVIGRSKRYVSALAQRKRGRLAHRLWAQTLESGLEAEGLLGAHNDRI